jgi:ribonuclease MRP protein subunit RMP1
MLMATLARFRRLIMPLSREIVEEAEDWEGISGGVVEQIELDFGEVVQRGEVEVEGDSGNKRGDEGETREAEEEKGDGVEVKKPKKPKKQSTAEAELSTGAVAESTQVKRPKKKRKKGDAFDDLFDSLI